MFWKRKMGERDDEKLFEMKRRREKSHMESLCDIAVRKMMRKCGFEHNDNTDEESSVVVRS